MPIAGWEKVDNQPERTDIQKNCPGKNRQILKGKV